MQQGPLRRLEPLGRLPGWVKSVAFIIVGFLLNSLKDMVSNYIASESDHGINNLQQHTITTSLWNMSLLVLSPVITLSALFVAYYIHASRKHADLHWTIDRMQNLELIYEKQINHIANLIRQQDQADLDVAMQNLLDEFLSEAADILPSKHVLRVTLLRLGTSTRELVPWSHHQMPVESVNKIHYSLSPQGRKTVAGQSYIDGKMRLARFVGLPGEKPKIQRVESDVWVDDDDATYDNFGRGKSKKLRYESFVVLPILGQGGKAMAALCFDSKELDTFSDVRMIKVLDTVRRVIVPAIQVYNDLSRASVSSRGLPQQSSQESSSFGVRRHRSSTRINHPQPNSNSSSQRRSKTSKQRRSAPNQNGK